MTSRIRASAALRLAVVLICLAALAPAASATETLTYSYDALGRLVKVARSGTVNNGASECYAYDRADNRSNVTVSTTSDCSGAITLTLSPTSVPNGTVGSAYSQTIAARGERRDEPVHLLDDGWYVAGRVEPEQLNGSALGNSHYGYDIQLHNHGKRQRQP